MSIRWTVAVLPRTGLLHIAGPGTRATDGAGIGELTPGTARPGCIIADSSRSEPTGFTVAARIVTAVVTAVAVLARFDDPVAALAGRDGCRCRIRADQTICSHPLGSHQGADIPNSAW